MYVSRLLNAYIKKKRVRPYTRARFFSILRHLCIILLMILLMLKPIIEGKSRHTSFCYIHKKFDRFFFFFFCIYICRWIVIRACFYLYTVSCIKKEEKGIFWFRLFVTIIKSLNKYFNYIIASFRYFGNFEFYNAAFTQVG